MTQPTLGLLAQLRPPTGFRTEAALGTTYSVDLLACMAALTTMDGSDGETLQYGKIEAFRALDRLRARVRICYHACRISRRDGVKYPSLALLDRVLLPVNMLDGRSFHPKVWLVRQVDRHGTERFVLVVSSRNMTSSTDWDLGIVITGEPDGPGVVLPQVSAFAQHVLRLSGDADRVDTLGNLDKVRWSRPPGVQDLLFGYQPGDQSSTLHSVWNVLPRTPSRVLLLSPFIDDLMIHEVAKRWGSTPTTQLVAGTDGLTRVALGPKRAELERLNPKAMTPASDMPEPPEVEDDGNADDEVEDARGLHAKVIAIDSERESTIIIGSHNLTSPGWRGRSTEAFIKLVGDATLSEPLWQWSAAQAQDFPFPTLGTSPPARSVLDQAKDDVQDVRFQFIDKAESPSRLELIHPPSLRLPAGVELHVARYTTPTPTVLFPSGSSAVELQGCPTAMRTHFVVCSLRHETEECSWIVAADLHPPLDDGRDRELVAQQLGLRQFLAYLQSLGSDEPFPGQAEGDDQSDGQKQNAKTSIAYFLDDVHLEGLLQRIVTQPEAFAEMDRAVSRYGELIKGGDESDDDKELLDRFLLAWRAIAEAFRK